MKKSRKSQSTSWVRVAAIIVVLAIAGYQWYNDNRQTIGLVAQQSEELKDSTDDNSPLQLEPKPKPASSSASTSSIDDEGSNSKEWDTASEVDSNKSLSDSSGLNSNSTKADKSPSTASRTPESSSKSVATDNDSFLRPAGGKSLKSPAGLLYSMGPGGEHRIEHVMRHSKNDLSRPSHGVFDGDQETILKVIDEAYELVKKKSKYVKVESSQGNQAFTVSLGRRIGYEGGEKGQRSGKRALSRVRLILDGERVITAYPFR